MINVLITGADGQLGYELQRTAPDNVQLYCTDNRNLDITSPSAIAAFFDDVSPDVVINAAAYTAVDQAEQDRDRAEAVNAYGPKYLATICKDRGTAMVHISTDFIFSGQQEAPYQSDDVAMPLSVYGRTKLQGEQFVQALLPSSSLIIRTAWVYSKHGNNFVKTMLRLMQEKTELSIVADQMGSPTWAFHLAQCVWDGALQLQNKRLPMAVYHYTDDGVASWFEFAVAIQREALELGLLATPIPIKPIRTVDYPTAAARPTYSVLDKSQTWRDLNAPKRDWRVALRSMLAELSC